MKFISNVEFHYQTERAGAQIRTSDKCNYDCSSANMFMVIGLFGPFAFATDV